GEVRPVDGAVEEGVGAVAGRDGGVRRRLVGVRGDRGDVGLLGDGEAEPAVVELPVAPDEAEPRIPLRPEELDADRPTIVRAARGHDVGVEAPRGRDRADEVAAAEAARADPAVRRWGDEVAEGA